MSFVLNVSGHIPPPPPPADPAAPAPPSQAEIELELYDALRLIFTSPAYGVYASSFAGNHVSGSLHEADTAS
jgi:hypothetical protein